MAGIDQKLAKLLSGYIDGLIEADEYKAKKETFLKQKIFFKEKKAAALRMLTSGWVEPTREFIKTARDAKNIASAKSPREISQFIRTVGSNRQLVGQNVEWNWVGPFDFLAKNLKNLCAVAAEHPKLYIPEKPESCDWWT